MSYSRTWRHRIALVRGWALLALPLFLIGLAVSPAMAQVKDNRAGLVVVHSDGRVLTRCVSFSEEQITGLTLLQRSGLSFTSASGPLGSTVCALDGEGCPASDCFCECKGTPCGYWTYFSRSPEGGWVYAHVGASMRQVHDGDVDAWVWGNGHQLPPPMSFEAICGGASPAPVDVRETPEPTATKPSPPSMPTPTYSPTSAPTRTPVPTPTPTSTLVPSPTTPVPPFTVTQIPSPSPTARMAMATSASVGQTPTPLPTVVTSPSPRSDTSGSAYLSFMGALALLGVAWLMVRSKGGGR